MNAKRNAETIEALVRETPAQISDKILILSALIAHDVPQHLVDRIGANMRIFRGSPSQFMAAGIPHTYKINHITNTTPPTLVVVYVPAERSD